MTTLAEIRQRFHNHLTDAEYECIHELEAELKRLRKEHTLVACTVCKRGVQNQHSVDGMCPTCAEAELERLRSIQARYDGSQRALSRLLAEHTELSEEAERLRGIEKAVMWPFQGAENPRRAAIAWYRYMSEHDDSSEIRREQWRLIANALEAKP